MWFDFSSGHSGLHLSGNVGGRVVGRLCRLSWVRFPEAGAGEQEREGKEAQQGVGSSGVLINKSHRSTFSTGQRIGISCSFS